MAVWFAAAMQTLQSAPAVGIIGGADGPTAVFLTQQLSPYSYIGLGALLVFAISVIVLWKGKKQ